MRINTILSGPSGLSGLCLALLFALPSSANQNPPGSGPAAGKWDTARPGSPGVLHGKLVTDRGEPVFELHARVLRRVPFLSTGLIVGRAERLRGPRAGEQVPVHGIWLSGGATHGTFQLALVEPRGWRNGKPQVVATARGGFHDDEPGRRPLGSFRGRWKRP